MKSQLTSQKQTVVPMKEVRQGKGIKIYLITYFYKKLFILIGKAYQLYREKERKIFHSLVYSPNSHNHQN